MNHSSSSSTRYITRTLPVLLGLCWCCTLVSCSTPAKKEDDELSSKNVVKASELAKPSKEKNAPRYIVVHRNTRLHVSPGEKSKYLQFRTDEQEVALIEAKRRARQEEERRKREEIARKKEEERKKKERLKKLRKKKKKKKKRRKKRKKKKKLTPEQIQALQEKAARERKKKAQAQIKEWRRRVLSDKTAHPNREHIVLKLIANRKGGWLEVETLSRRQQRSHCHHSSHPGLAPYNLRFFIKKDALKTVLTRPEKFALRQQTRVHLQPGLILDTSSSQTRVLVDGFTFKLDVPRDVIGTYYHHPHTFNQDETDTVFSPVAFAEKLIKIDKRYIFSYNPYYPLFILQVARAGKWSYPTVQTRCGEYIVRTEHEWVETLTHRAAKSIQGSDEDTPPPYIKKGTALTHTNGKPFGKAALRIPLEGSLRKDDKRACMKQRVWSNAETSHDTVVVCAPLNALVEE